MSASSRRLIGIVVAVVLVFGTIGFSAWRLRVIHARGWAGLTYLPRPSTKKPLPAMPFGWRFGSVMMIFPSSPAEKAGIHQGDSIQSINGVCTCDADGLTKLDDRLHRGDIVVYRIERNGVARDVRVPLRSQLQWPAFVVSLIISPLVGLVFFVIGSAIFWRRPDDRRSVVFFAMTTVAAIYFISSPVGALDAGSMRGIAGQSPSSIPQVIIFTGTAMLFAPLLLHLALIFPRPRPILDRYPRIMRWVYGPPATLAVSLGILVLFATAAHKSRALAWVVGCLVILATAVALVALAIELRRHRREAVLRKPLTTQIAVIGLIVLSLAFVVPRLQNVMAGAVAVTLITIVTIFVGFLSYPIATIITLYRSYRDADVEEKRQVKWPLWASILVLSLKVVAAAVGYAITFTCVMALHTFPPVWTQFIDFLPRLAYVLIPISFAIAIAKYRLMNIDLIIRRTVTYAMLSVAVFIVYGVLVAGVGTLLVRFAGVQNQAMVIASTIVVALVAVPLRNTLQRLVDRNVFRERVSHPLALRTLADAIGTGIAREELLRLLAEQLQLALQNRVVLVAMRSDQHFVAAAKVGVADEILGSFRVPAAGVELVRPLDPERDPLPLQLAQRLRRLGATLVVPMRAQRDAIGFVALGAKLSNEPFSTEDIAFIEAATTQAAMALETSRLRTEEVEFEQARAMQQVLLPTELPRLDGFDIAGMWQPARSVGGDYYDAIAVGDGKAALCIADVAGKGMSAALLMASLQAAVKATAAADMPPSRVCNKVRQVVTGNLAGGTFITFFYALLDTAARTLTYCNAGHNPPLLVRASGDVERLDVGGSVLGRLFRTETYDEATVTLAAGDRVVLFTDGVSEARRGGEDFGDERLIDVVRSNRELGAEELQEKIVEAITAFTSGSFGDDVTLVVIGAK
jgi:sigma-B regulation protein RsbU (phosphoserine phosphatase)